MNLLREFDNKLNSLNYSDFINWYDDHYLEIITSNFREDYNMLFIKKYNQFESLDKVILEKWRNESFDNTTNRI